MHHPTDEKFENSTFDGTRLKKYYWSKSTNWTNERWGGTNSKNLNNSSKCADGIQKTTILHKIIFHNVN